MNGNFIVFILSEDFYSFLNIYIFHRLNSEIIFYPLFITFYKQKIEILEYMPASLHIMEIISFKENDLNIWFWY